MKILPLIFGLALAQISIDLKTKQNHKSIRELSRTDLYNEFFYYTGKLWIGNPGQEFEMRFSTGASYTWVDSSTCSQCTSGSDRFDPSQSYTYTNLTTKVSEVYSSGYGLSGHLSKDMIAIGDSSKIAANSYFILAYQENLNSEGYSGVAGLAFSGLSDGYPTLVDSLKASGQISRRIFAMYLNYFPLTKGIYGNPASNLMIGGYDLKKYSIGNIIVTVPLISDSDFWSVVFETAYLDSEAIVTTIPVMFTSGSTLITVESVGFGQIQNYLVKNNYNCGIDSYGYIICDCYSVENMFDFSLSYDGVMLKAKKETIWIYSQGTCTLLIVEADISYWILSSVFLSNYYMIYDMDNREISFAPAVTASDGNSNSGAFILTMYALILLL